MKHHFGDELDRRDGHWTIVPNFDRHAYRVAEWTGELRSISIATIGSDDANWELLEDFPNLEELTLHSPNKEQIAFVSRLPRLKRLRITHARPKNIDHLAGLKNLEELVLEYVSGFDDLSPLADLQKLRSLHIENLRRVSDFSALSGAKSLRYLSIQGSIDWFQPVNSFSFLSCLPNLEHLRLRSIKPPNSDEPLSGLLTLMKLRRLDFAMNAFPLEVFAWLEAKLNKIEGARIPAFKKFGGEDQEIRHRDIRFRMPIAEFENCPDLFVGADGKRYARIPYQAVLLGRGQRTVRGSEEAVDQACSKHAAKYAKLLGQLKSSEN